MRYDRESCYYHVFNRVSGEPGWHPFGEVEREEMFRIMDHVNKLYAIDIVSFVAMGNHFHAVVRAPSELPGLAEVKRRFKAYYGKDREAPDWRMKVNYETYARRMRDVSALMKDFQQHFTNWFNRTRPHGRRGGLWADRYKSVILESGRAVWECVQYVEMNPVRAGLVADSADYRHSTWGMLCGSGEHRFRVRLSDHLIGGLKEEVLISKRRHNEEQLNDEEVITCLRIKLAQLTAIESGADEAAFTEAENLARKKPSFMLTSQRRMRHWTEGAIIGSKLFVKNLTAEFYGDERAEKKRFDDSGAGLVSFRQLK
ncbi:MAG: transposase [Lentisphaeria bacterium]|nr:transposase [Lentisphaeria bacterium]